MAVFVHLFSFLVCLAAVVNAVEVIEGSLFNCSETVQIESAFTCDGSVDCYNWADETVALCGARKCFDDEKPCKKSYQCLLETYACDGFRDCHDGSDEEDCPDIVEGYPIYDDITTPPTTTTTTTTTKQTTTTIKQNVVTAVAEKPIPKKCFRKPSSKKCKEFIPRIAAALKEKCSKKPNSKLCKTTTTNQNVVTAVDVNPIPKKCFRKPSLKKCEEFIPRIAAGLKKKCSKKPNSKRCLAIKMVCESFPLVNDCAAIAALPKSSPKSKKSKKSKGGKKKRAKTTI